MVDHALNMLKVLGSTPRTENAIIIITITITKIVVNLK